MLNKEMKFIDSLQIYIIYDFNENFLIQNLNIIRKAYINKNYKNK